MFVLSLSQVVLLIVCGSTLLAAVILILFNKELAEYIQ